jgi:hypothetical protein
MSLYRHRDRVDLGVYRNLRSGGKVASKRITQVAFPEMIGDFDISQMLPAFRLSEPFPAILWMKNRLLTA